MPINRSDMRHERSLNDSLTVVATCASLTGFWIAIKKKSFHEQELLSKASRNTYILNVEANYMHTLIHKNSDAYRRPETAEDNFPPARTVSKLLTRTRKNIYADEA